MARIKVRAQLKDPCFKIAYFSYTNRCATFKKNRKLI